MIAAAVQTVETNAYTSMLMMSLYIIHGSLVTKEVMVRDYTAVGERVAPGKSVPSSPTKI